MGPGSLTPQAKSGSTSWKLKPPHDAQTQGLVVSGFGTLPWAEALFLESTEAGAGWIATLRAAAPITDASTKQDRCAALAFTCSGLAKVGLEDGDLATFAGPFREGMHYEDRLRRLGDKIDGEWQPTVVPGGLTWGGNNEGKASSAFKTVHALLLLYDASQEDVRRWAGEIAGILAPLGVKVVARLSLDLQVDKDNIAREHFGFADGLSQPIPYGDAVIPGDNQPPKGNPWHGVPLGEILLGHTNAHHEEAPGPYVRSETNRVADLTRDGAPEGFLNLGLNGSYMVVRELRQDVAAFWKSLRANAERIRAHDPQATWVTPDWIAERIVGRTVNGDMLCPGGTVQRATDQPQNDVGFLQHDPYGYGCPVGSHVRRSNPRDGLAPDPSAGQTSLDAANNHRILRRGRKFGPPVVDPHQDDGQNRGLLFICLNSDIARQFEFVQQTWVMNQNFATLFDEMDPLVGPKGRFTIRDEASPLRRIIEVETFIQASGGEYFFLPSIPALDYLASL